MHVLFPGSFDPPTLGHLALLRRAAALFDRVTVGIFINPDKSYLFTPEERREMIRLATADLPSVSPGLFRSPSPELRCRGC